jgi:nucleotide-binding universal stress UspA family protein
MKILFAVDGSDCTRSALDYLTTHEWPARGSSLSVFTVALPVPHRAAAFAGPQLVHLYYADDAEQALRPVRDRLAGYRAEVDYSYAVGHPAEAIVHKAESEHFDLIVMGTHGRGALANVVLGSVATKVLATCRIPVLLMR